ncbi:MAG: hypothetical protein H0U60_12345 [Blastocatellia bacterium]|nr:hypothetical protein [Blastocatellia bacterium]
MLAGEQRIAAARARLKPGCPLAGVALLVDVAGRLRGALRIADVEREAALAMVAEAYVLLKLLLEDEE